MLSSPSLTLSRREGKKKNDPIGQRPHPQRKKGSSGQDTCTRSSNIQPFQKQPLPANLFLFFLLNWAGLDSSRWLTTQPHGAGIRSHILTANEAGHWNRHLLGPSPQQSPNGEFLPQKVCLPPVIINNTSFQSAITLKVTVSEQKSLLKLSRHNWNISSQVEI